MAAHNQKARIQAVLGPTNTGKTHYALERMVGYASGMMGFPLRLLAREIYDRVVKVKGAAQVALITGEEKILPAHPRYFLCTTESMPLDRAVDFVGIDEIQMCADPERGHIFTDRLLHARGTQETLFLGSDSMRPLISKLVPGVEFITRPRLSQLTYAGPKKLARLPPKSAIVAFSASEVYAMAEYVRRGRGGAAVVLGALSPRTRNAQIALYQAGEVDYIVATDAIGMGLNMDVDHVAFASLRKFDGRNPRLLTAPEIAQIAGRAGRHMNDGTFGATADLSGIDPALVMAVESHKFPAVKALSWRNTDLKFISPEALLASLEKMPDRVGLIRAGEADDVQALKILMADPDIHTRAKDVDRVSLLWEVCQIPDFRKVMAENHTKLLALLYTHLTNPKGKVPTDVIAAQVGRLDRLDGDIATLMGRIAGVRTWTYVSHRNEWVQDAAHWQTETRALEDKLSDALHAALTERFIDRRTALLVRRLKDPSQLMGDVDAEGKVRVEGQSIGQLDGFRFLSDEAGNAHAARAVLSAAAVALKPEIATRIDQLAVDDDQAFRLTDWGEILWRGQAVARMVSGPDRLHPRVEALPSDLLSPQQRDRIRGRAALWVEDFIRHHFGVLADPKLAGTKGPLRGLLHSLGVGLGSMARDQAADLIAALSDPDRKRLRALGIRLGRLHVFAPLLFKAKILRLRALLQFVHLGGPELEPALSLPADKRIGAEDYAALGYAVVAGLALRIDKLDKFLETASQAAKETKSFAPPHSLGQMLALSPEQVGKVLVAQGYRGQMDGTYLVPKAGRKPVKEGKKINEDSPFAVLKRG